MIQFTARIAGENRTVTGTSLLSDIDGTYYIGNDVKWIDGYDWRCSDYIQIVESTITMKIV